MAVAGNVFAIMQVSQPEQQAKLSRYGGMHNTAEPACDLCLWL